MRLYKVWTFTYVQYKRVKQLLSHELSQNPIARLPYLDFSKDLYLLVIAHGAASRLSFAHGSQLLSVIYSEGNGLYLYIVLRGAL